MSKVEILLENSSNNCTMYTIQLPSDEDSEFGKFVSKSFLDYVQGVLDMEKKTGEYILTAEEE